ncbi:MAG: 3'-5' exonuclease, partial [Thiobacillus sp.]|nr:3'-5' exonuclease [Thiobacillus sp.]
MDTVAVIDFETTGLSPAMGDRATEVAVVIVDNGIIVDRYQSLMHSGAYIPPFIASLTGISNAMLSKAPPAAEVMHALAEFVGDFPLVAHNAS